MWTSRPSSRRSKTIAVQDVETERAIDGMIADLPPIERAISIMDRQANNRGVKLDLKFVAALKALALDETDEAQP